jgi:predicted phage terminase large subunit-like protein
MSTSPSGTEAIESRVELMVSMLDDPAIGEGVKATIRDGLQQLAQGGFRQAYESQLTYNARTNLDAFAECVYELPPFPHHREITKVLQDDSKKRVLIIAPPGHAKSTYVSLIYPAWWMGKYPDKAAIMVSNTATQASKFASSIREIIASDRKFKSVFPETRPDEARGWTREELFLGNRSNKSRPDPNLFATGMTGPVLGRRAELIIVDDPTSQQDATSETVMDQQKLWFKQTLMSRLKPGGRCVVILTRWHDKDLASMLVHDMDFEVVHMVAIGDEEHGAYVDYLPPGAQPEGDEVDPRLLSIQEEVEHEGYRTKIAKSHTAGTRKAVRKYLYSDGERALWRTEHDMAALNRIKQDYGSVQFNLVYQGDPTGLQGDIFKREWFEYYGPGDDCNKRSVPADAYWFQSVDVAVSQKKGADYTVVATCALDNEGNFFIHDIARQRIEAPDQPKLLERKYKQYPKTLWVLIETVAYQLSLFQNVIRKGIPARSYKPQKNKVMRARSAAAFFEARKVYFRKDKLSAKWLGIVEDEFTSFPRGEHDDCVDAISSLLEELALYFVDPEPVELEVEFGSDLD